MKTLKALARLILGLILLIAIFGTVTEVTSEICYEFFGFYRKTRNIIGTTIGTLVTLVTFIIIVKYGLSGFFKKAFHLHRLNRHTANPCYMVQPYSVIALGAIWYAVNWMAYNVLNALDLIHYWEHHWPIIIASAFVFWLYYPVIWGKVSK